MSKSTLISLARAEIAQRGTKSSPVCYFLTLIAVALAFITQNYFVLALSLAMAITVFLQTQTAKKVFADPSDNSSWNLLRLQHLIFAATIAAIFVTTVLKTENYLHLVVMFTVLAGAAGHFLLVTSIDRSVVLPALAVLHIPLIGASIFNYSQQNSSENLFLLLIYINCLIYSLIQFRFLNRQIGFILNTRLELEKANAELKNIDQKQDFFIQLVLTLLNNKVPLEQVFHSIIGFFENQNSGWLCSILFLDQNKKRFHQAYAPSIDDFYNQAIENLEIGPSVGSCGTAAFKGERVIVENIQTSPLWAPYRELAAKAKLAACWSQPIKDQNNHVIGTFAIYHREPNAPSENDIRMIEQAAELVSIVLQHIETESMVRKTQDELSLIYNSAIDPMWLMDVEEGEKYRFRSVNDAHEAATGISREHVIGKLIEEAIPPQIAESTKARYHEVKTTGKVIDYIDVAVFPTGTKAGLIRLKPIFDENGVCTKILGIVEDITEKQQMNKLLSQRETELIYAQKIARLGTWKWDLVNGENSFASKEMAEMLEINDTNVPKVSINDVDFFTEESWIKAKPVVEEALTSGKPYEVDLARKMKNGQLRWFTARGEVIERNREGQPTLVAGTMQDITERKLLENNLTAALKSRDEFIAVASHELKTPLTTIQLSLHVILKQLEDNGAALSEQFRHKLMRAKAQGDRLGALIDNLLDVTRMGSGKIQMNFQSDANISELTQNVLKKYEEEIFRSGSALTKEIEPAVIGNWDLMRLEQIVTNLLTNAIKYGDSKPIHVSLKLKNHTAILSVSDNGIGIPAHKKDKIFDRFERAVSETNYQGLGLGLWIVSEIVKAHKGTLSVESTEGQGSKFTVEIPLSGGQI